MESSVVIVTPNHLHIFFVRRYTYSANFGAVLYRFYRSHDTTSGGDPNHHVARPLQQDNWTKGKDGFLGLFSDLQLWAEFWFRNEEFWYDSLVH